jgi:hypothetical protein
MWKQRSERSPSRAGANASGIPVEAGQLVSRARVYANFVLDQNDHGGVVSGGD